MSLAIAFNRFPPTPLGSQGSSLSPQAPQLTIPPPTKSTPQVVLMASRPPAGRGISTKKASSLVCPQGNRCSSSTLQSNSSGKLPSHKGRLSHRLELPARHHLSLKPKDSGGNHLMHATHTENTSIYIFIYIFINYIQKQAQKHTKQLYKL